MYMRVKEEKEGHVTCCSNYICWIVKRSVRRMLHMLAAFRSLWNFAAKNEYAKNKLKQYIS